MSGHAGDVEQVVHTLRAVGPVTDELHRLRAGAIVGLRGPFGTPWPVEAVEGSDIVLLAGGIGLAPLRPALYHVLARRERYGRVVVLFGARTPHDILFTRGDRAVARPLRHHRGGGRRSRSDGLARLRRCRHIAHPRAPFDPTQAVAMVCGPEIMMKFGVQELAARGVPASRVYVSLERNMKCAVGLCGHCQLGPTFICKDGPVYRYDTVSALLGIREV